MHTSYSEPGTQSPCLRPYLTMQELNLTPFDSEIVWIQKIETHITRQMLNRPF